MLATWKSLVRNAVLCGIAAGLWLSAATSAVAQEATPQTTLKLYHLKYIDAQEAGSVVTQVLKSDDNMRIAVDARTNSLVVSGLAETLAQIEGLLQSLDQEHVDRATTKPGLPPVQVRIFWLVSSERANPLPERLQPVAAELESLGITDLRLAGQMAVNVGKANRPFSVSGRQLVDNHPYKLQFDGVLTMGERGVPNLEASIAYGSARDEDDARMGSIDTAIEAPLNQFVVLGSTDVGLTNSVFVLQLVPRPTAVPAK